MNFVYPNNPDKICFWSRLRGDQKTLTLSSASWQVKAQFIDFLYREIKYRIGRGGEYDIFISIDPTNNQLSISVPIKKSAYIGASIPQGQPLLNRSLSTTSPRTGKFPTPSMRTTSRTSCAPSPMWTPPGTDSWRTRHSISRHTTPRTTTDPSHSTQKRTASRLSQPRIQ